MRATIKKVFGERNVLVSEHKKASRNGASREPLNVEVIAFQDRDETGVDESRYELLRMLADEIDGEPKTMLTVGVSSYVRVVFFGPEPGSGESARIILEGPRNSLYEFTIRRVPHF